MQGRFGRRCLPLRCPLADGFALRSFFFFFSSSGVFSWLILVLVGFLIPDDGTFLVFKLKSSCVYNNT